MPINPTVDLPVDVNPFFDRAFAFVRARQHTIPIDTAILDDWNGPEGVKTVRIVYGGPFTTNCGSRCETCPLYQQVGEDPPRTGAAHADFSPALTQAEDRHLEVFGAKTQRFLNCKT